MLIIKMNVNTNNWSLFIALLLDDSNLSWYFFLAMINQFLKSGIKLLCKLFSFIYNQERLKWEKITHQIQF